MLWLFLERQINIAVLVFVNKTFADVIVLVIYTILAKYKSTVNKCSCAACMYGRIHSHIVAVHSTCSSRVARAIYYTWNWDVRSLFKIFFCDKFIYFIYKYTQTRISFLIHDHTPILIQRLPFQVHVYQLPSAFRPYFHCCQRYISSLSLSMLQANTFPYEWSVVLREIISCSGNCMIWQCILIELNYLVRTRGIIDWLPSLLSNLKSFNYRYVCILQWDMYVVKITTIYQ